MSDTHAQTVPYVRDTMMPQQEPPSREVRCGALDAREPVFRPDQLDPDHSRHLLAVFFIVKSAQPWLLHSVWNAEFAVRMP